MPLKDLGRESGGSVNTIVHSYLGQLIRLAQQPESTPELSLRPALTFLLESIARIHNVPELLLIPEGRTMGQPDYIIKSGTSIVGYVETKAPGADLSPNTEQLRRYIDGLPNLLITDYNVFDWYLEGECILSFNLGLSIAIRHLDSNRARIAAEADENLVAFLHRFFSFVAPSVADANELAIALAKRASILRDSISNQISNDAASPFISIFQFFERELYPDITADIFSDTISQTLIYGLFLGRLQFAEDRPFNLRDARHAIPETVPFLRNAMRIAGDDDDLEGNDVVWILNDVIALLSKIDVNSIKAQFTGAGRDDTVLYFYEPFLRAYDPEQRIERGVYYTPSPLVDYVIQAIEDVLREKLDRPLGLGDPSVTLLDPAVGTGTFIIAALNSALEAIVEQRGTGAVHEAISRELPQRAIGFEVLPAPYAIAQLRMASFLESHGANLKTAMRPRIYLTNTLNEPVAHAHDYQPLPIIQNLVDEVGAGDLVKTNERILVILGNPPFERDSPYNNTIYVRRLMADFRNVDGIPIRERNQKALNADYVRFFRWSFAKLLEFEPHLDSGIIAFVSNNSFTDALTLRGMRKWMLDHFDEIYVFNLRGDQREWIRGQQDEKIFSEVQVGIAITIAIRRRERHGSCIFKYRETVGTVSEKFAAIRQAKLFEDEAWSQFAPIAPYYLFLPNDIDVRYETWPQVSQLFRVGGVGCQTARDRFIVATSPSELRKRFRDFSDRGVSNETLWDRYKLRANRQFNIDQLRNSAIAFDETRVIRYLYRQLDYRYIYKDDRFVDWPGQSASHFIGNDNIGLAVPRQRRGDGQLATFTTSMSDLNLLGSGTHIYPLLHFGHTLGGGGDEFRSASNLNTVLIAALDVAYDTKITDVEVFYYIGGILSSRYYAMQFADRLTINFPRIPFPTDIDLFRLVVTAATPLIRLQLLNLTDDELTSRLHGNGALPVGRVRYDAESETVHLATGLTLAPVSNAIWAYKIGQHYVLENYLRARVGQVLVASEQRDLRSIVASIDGTLRHMDELDDSVEAVIKALCLNGLI